MNKRAFILVAVSALICGALLGYFIRPSTPVPAAPAAPVERPPRKTVKTTDDAALNRLRARIADLERQLAEKPAATTEEAVPEPATPPTAARSERRGPPAPEDMRARMEDMRRNDPERYTQMTNRFAHMRARQLDHAQNKLDILASVDPAQLTPEQRDLHDQYQDLIARQEELRNLAFAPLEDAAVTDEQRRAAHEELRQNGRELHRLAQTERQILLEQTARSFGVKGEAAKELVETVKAVYQATTEAWGGPGRHGGGRRR